MQQRAHLPLVRDNPEAQYGRDRLFALDLGGRGMAAFDSDQSDGAHGPYPLAPASFAARVRTWEAAGGSAVPISLGLNSNITGSVIARDIGSDTFAAGVTRLGIASNLQALGGGTAYAGWRHGAGLVYRNTGDQYKAGGFTFAARLAINSSQPSMRFFAGLVAQTAAINAQPSSLQNAIGFAADSGESAVSFLTTAASGSSPQKTPIANWFKTEEQTMLDLLIYCGRMNAQIGFAWRKLPTLKWNTQVITPTTAPGSLVVLSPQISIASTSGYQNPVSMDLSSVYVETEF